MQLPIFPDDPRWVISTCSALFLQPLQFAVPTYLLASGQPRRDGFVRRCILAYLGIAVFNIAISMAVWWGSSFPPTGIARYAVNAIAYTLYLCVLVIAIRSCFDMNLWNALFCATAGYTIQNLGSGTGELVRLELAVPFDTIESTLCVDFSTVAIIVLYYFVYIRRARRIGRLGDDARTMLGLLVLVIMVVITFDVVVRGLERAGAQTGFLIALRVVHIAVCMFMLYAEIEALVNARLRAEVAARDLIAEERGRQYKLSRETIAAVNRRVHDIRHKVVRELSEGPAQVSRETLESIVRDISIYDTAVKTGNDALDTILTEKSLACARRGIALSCIADGTALAHLGAADLYALFSLLLDSAVEAVCDLEDERLRSISLTLRRVGDLALLHVEHYRGEAAMPQYASVREIVERYGGTFSASRRDNAQVLDAMIPIP